MIVLGPRKNPVGAKLTVAERRALNIEIRKSIAEWDRSNELNIEACILWALHTTFGFGPKLLKRYYQSFLDTFRDMVAWYELDTDEVGGAALVKLKNYGVDLEAWKADENG